MRILGLIATLVILGQPLMAETAPPMISVTGEGRINVAPDMATVTLGVTTEADTAKAAMDANSAQLSAAIAALKAAGIEDKDIQTTGLSLGPRYDYNRTKSDGTAQITGFVASNNVTVRVRALAGLGEVLDAVVTDGANTLNGVAFGLQDPDPALDAARKDAVADARRKAELYAAAAGVTLGAIQSISEQSGYAPPMPMALAEASFAKDASVPVAAGEVGVTAQVSIVWLIGE
jgi:uncharacterized protein